MPVTHGVAGSSPVRTAKEQSEIPIALFVLYPFLFLHKSQPLGIICVDYFVNLLDCPTFSKITNMKRFIFTILAFMVAAPALLFGQNEKYMSGAVPVTDGKVVFERELNVPLFSEEQIYNALADWAGKKFTGKSNRIISSDKSKSTLLVQGEDEMVIKIGLFPGKVKVHYILAADCANGKCTLKTTRIKYSNNPASKKSTDIIYAEEYITDKYALNKSKTKIFAGTGDYRKNTIDIVDNVAQEAQDAIYTFNTSSANNTATNKTTANNTAANKAETATENTTGISEEIKNAVAQKGLSIVSVGGRKLNRPIACKGGMNINGDKVFAMISIEADVDNVMFIMEMAENYTLALMDEAGSTPMVTFNCKKNQQFDKTFIGEVVSVFNGK